MLMISFLPTFLGGCPGSLFHARAFTLVYSFQSVDLLLHDGDTLVHIRIHIQHMNLDIFRLLRGFDKRGASRSGAVDSRSKDFLSRSSKCAALYFVLLILTFSVSTCLIERLCRTPLSLAK